MNQVSFISEKGKKSILLQLVVTIVIALTPLQPLLAQVNSLDFTGNDIQTYDPRATLCAPGGGSSGDSQLVGGDTEQNEKDAFFYFTGKGLAPHRAAGIIGNLMQESQMNPKVIQSNGVGHGIAQWSKNGRWAELQKWAGSRDIWALGTQLDFIWHEMSNVPPWNKTIPALQAAGDVEAATYAFEQNYEKAGQPNMTNRIKYAQNAMRFAGQAPNAAGTPVTTTTQGCTSGGGIGTVDGFTFPLQTRKSVILNDSGVKWCSNQQTNCHHDYNAADIGAPTGTVVVAAKGGVVEHLREGKDANIGILGEDKNFYYYAHMNGSIKARKGDKVAAGQPLGQVGTAADNDANAPPHLHIDVQPPPATGRPSCSGAACNAYTFINIQPPLIKAFQALPE